MWFVLRLKRNNLTLSTVIGVIAFSFYLEGIKNQPPIAMKHFVLIILCSTLLSCDSSNKSPSPIEGISGFSDLELGIQSAEESNKPILLYFTAWASVSDRKMEEEILIADHVFKKLRDEFVIVALYTDDRINLPKADTSYHNGVAKIITTVGEKNSRFQTQRFDNNSQPHFVILSSNGEDVIDQFGYLPDAEKVDSILSMALEKYKMNKF